MAKLTLSPVGNFTSIGLGTMNSNWDKIEAAVELLLSRDGQSPNQMQADFDLNHNDLLNIDNLDVARIDVNELYINDTQVIPGDPDTVDVTAIFDAISINEDDMESDSATKVPTQRSVKANIDARAPKGRFNTVAAMLADTDFGYSATRFAVATGDIIEAGGFRYEVAASVATDHHRATAGGVKLYVLDRLNFRAWGPSLAGNDDGPLMQKAVDALTEGEELDLKRLTVTVSGVSVDTNYARVVNGKLVAHSSITANAVIKAAAGTDGVEFENLRVEVDKDAIAAEDCGCIFFDQGASGKAINCRVNGSRNENYNYDVDYGIIGSIGGYKASDVEIINCKSYSAHREGILGHKCDRWTVIGGGARDSGYSNIGTAGGTKAKVIGVWSSGSGSSGISINSIDSLVSDNTVDTNALNNAILIGHSEHADSYAQNCLITDNRVIGTAGSGAATGRGVSIVYGINCVIANNVVTDVIDYGIYFIPHPTEPGGCVIIGNTVDGCTHGIYAYGAGTGSFLANSNTIRNASVWAVLAFTNGEVSVIANVLSESLGGVNAGGHVTGSTLTGDGITLLKVDDNTMRNIGQNALSCRHLRGLSFSDNILENINTSNNAFAHILAIQGTNGGTASRMPTSITMNGNSTKGTSTSSKLVNIEANTYGDGVVTLISANDNVLPDLAPSRMFGGAGAGTTAKMRGGGNQIGTDDRFLTVTLLAASTSLVVANSNICPGINGLPVVMPTNANWPSNVRFTIVNGSVTLNYSAPASDATAYMQVA